MSFDSGWHWFIAVFTVLNIIGCVWLIVWSSRQGDMAEAGDNTTGHVWDGVKESNNPLPRWWLYLFVGTIIWGLGYLVYYPGLGAFEGVGGWSQLGQYGEERNRIDAVYNATFAEFAKLDFTALSQNEEAMASASRLYGTNCATCHGSDARGAAGFPNLTDQDWQWGGSPEAVTQSITLGRQGIMTPWEAVLGEDGVAATVAYVQQLSGASVDAAQAEAGKTHFNTVCMACHGTDGKGNPMLGAPNLTDEVWLYGGSADVLTQTIAKGRHGIMPAHGELLNADEIKLLAAYVLSLGQPGASAGSP